MILALLGTPTRTNVQLAYAWRELGVDARVLWPREATELLGPDDVALVRLDVLPGLDGVEPGLELVPELAERGVRVLNDPAALLAAHDKLLTAERLRHAGLPTPWTRHLGPGTAVPEAPSHASSSRASGAGARTCSAAARRRSSTTCSAWSRPGRGGEGTERSFRSSWATASGTPD